MSEDKIYPSMVIRSQAETIELLEKENQKLKEQLDKYENPEDLTLMFMYCNEQFKDKIKKLENQLKQRDEVIEEAIEFIKFNGRYCEEYHLCAIPFNTLKLDTLLDILQKYKGDNK